MNIIRGFYFDGESARAWPVLLCKVEQDLVIKGVNFTFRVPLATVQSKSRIGNTRRVMRLHGGEIIHTDDNDTIDAWFPRQNRFEGWVYRLERAWSSAIAGALVSLVLGGAFFVFGLPRIADEVATRMPPQAERLLGRQSLAIIDRLDFEPSGLKKERAAALKNRLADFSEYIGIREVDFQFRKAGYSNAFCLPGGIVILTDELVEQLTEDQVLAVVAHELGHHRHHHVMRSVLRSSGIVILAALVTGDAGSAATSATAAVTFLLEQGYSREFETEADSFAFSALEEYDMSPMDFADALRALDQGVDKGKRKKDKAADESSGFSSYLSSHPDSTERIEAAEQAAKDYYDSDD